MFPKHFVMANYLLLKYWSDLQLEGLQTQVLTISHICWNKQIKHYETKVGVIPLPTNELKSEESMLLTDESKVIVYSLFSVCVCTYINFWKTPWLRFRVKLVSFYFLKYVDTFLWCQKPRLLQSSNESVKTLLFFLLSSHWSHKSEFFNFKSEISFHDNQRQPEFFLYHVFKQNSFHCSFYICRLWNLLETFSRKNAKRKNMNKRPLSI